MSVYALTVRQQSTWRCYSSSERSQAQVPMVRRASLPSACDRRHPCFLAGGHTLAFVQKSLGLRNVLPSPVYSGRQRCPIGPKQDRHRDTDDLVTPLPSLPLLPRVGRYAIADAASLIGRRSLGEPSSMPILPSAMPILPSTTGSTKRIKRVGRQLKDSRTLIFLCSTPLSS